MKEMRSYSKVWFKLINLFVLLQQMFQLKKLKADPVKMPDKTKMPNHTVVPYEVLVLLIDYIPHYADHVRFKSVCNLWRVVESQHPGPPTVLPWLMLTFSDGKSKFYELCSRYYYGNPIKVESKAAYYGYCDGWMFGFSESKRFFLENVYSGEKCLLPRKSSICSVPDLSQPCALPTCKGINMPHVEIYKTVFSCSPSSSDFFMASINQQGCALTIFEPNSDGALATTVHLGGQGFVSIMFHSGTLIGVDRSKTLHTFFIEKNERGLAQVVGIEKLKMKKFDLPVSNFPNKPICNIHSTYLVEVSCELLMVIRYYGGSGHTDTYTIGFKVFKMVWNTPLEWEEVKSLHGHAIFLDSYAVRAFHASVFPGIKGDHIYFTSCSELFDTGVFSMRDQSIGLILPAKDFPGLVKSIWLFPPNCRLEPTKNMEDEKSLS